VGCRSVPPGGRLEAAVRRVRAGSYPAPARFPLGGNPGRKTRACVREIGCILRPIRSVWTQGHHRSPQAPRATTGHHRLPGPPQVTTGSQGHHRLPGTPQAPRATTGHHRLPGTPHGPIPRAARDPSGSSRIPRAARDPSGSSGSPSREKWGAANFLKPLCCGRLMVVGGSFSRILAGFSAASGRYLGSASWRGTH